MTIWMKILHAFTSPFAYETGFYFEGKKAFHMNPLAIFPFAGLAFLITAYVVLFEPVLMGTFVDSEMAVSAFNTHANVPNEISSPHMLS